MTFSLLISTGYSATAFLATAAAFSVWPNILGRVFVSLGAMSNTFAALEMRNDGSSIAKATPQISLKRNRLKMLRINAAANTAQMIQLQSRRNWTAVEFVCNAMGFSPFSSIIAHNPISTSIDSAHPNPTARFGNQHAIAGQSLDCITIPISHVTPFSRIGQGCAALLAPLRPALHSTSESAA